MARNTRIALAVVRRSDQTANDTIMRTLPITEATDEIIVVIMGPLVSCVMFEGSQTFAMRAPLPSIIALDSRSRSS